MQRDRLRVGGYNSGFESGPAGGVFADDGAFKFAFGSTGRRDIDLGARTPILYDHCVRWGMMPHTAGISKDCCNLHPSNGQPVATTSNLREFLPDHDEATPPIKMGDGEAPGQ